jgi:hypothetical protein
MIDVSKFVAIGSAPTVPFGVDKVRTIEALREMADKIERGEVILLGIDILQSADAKDFAQSKMLLAYAERNPPTA